MACNFTKTLLVKICVSVIFLAIVCTCSRFLKLDPPSGAEVLEGHVLGHGGLHFTLHSVWLESAYELHSQPLFVLEAGAFVYTF